MKNPLYLRFEYSPNLIFPPKSKSSCPFPPDLIPEPLYSIYLFIENVEKMYFLRHTQLQHFCIPIEVKVLNYLDAGEVVESLNVYFQGESRSVGYRFQGKASYSLTFHQTDKKLTELSDELKYIYSMGNNQRSSNFKWHESEVSNFENEKYLSDNNLKPIGKWEASLFRGAFNSNPHILSDDEFEMIFGSPR